MKDKIVQRKSIGIIGGMGPQASSQLLRMIIDLSASEFGAKNGEDFPEVLLLSLPISDFISDKNKAKLALEVIKNKISLLNEANLGCLAIACNTAHLFLEELQTFTKIPFVSVIDEVSNRVQKNGIKRIGLLASPTTIRSKIYQEALSARGINTIVPINKESKVIEKIIRNVIGGKNSIKDTGLVHSIAESLTKRGAEGVILGCTELNLVFSKNSSFPVFDSLEILAHALLRKRHKLNTIRSI